MQLHKSTSTHTRRLIVVIFLLFPLSVAANFDFNANCIKAYQLILELKLNTARQLIAAEKKMQPNNAIVPLLENYVDYFYLLSTDRQQDFERLENNRIGRLAQISKDDAKSPYYLYAQAEINLQWAIIRVRYGSYYTAAREINRANNLLKENSKKFPGFHLNYKGLGFINAVMGSIPDGFFKTTLAAFGIKGDVQTGLLMLDKLAENLPKSAYEPFYEEVIFYYTYVLTDIAHQPNAYAKTMKYTARFADSSLLKAYLQGYVALKTGHNEEAIAALIDRPSGQVYQSVPYLDYLMGLAKLNKLDYNAANYFDRFLQTNRGVNYIKDTYLHLAWIALLKGNEAGYSNAIMKLKENGYSYQDRDKQAINDANSPTPHLQLLRARLLYDGGYFTMAMDVLDNCKIEDFATLKDRAEYQYRLGRVNEALGKSDAAIANYQSAINNGKALKYYYAAKSALYAAEIYEKRKNTTQAKTYFNMAIAMKNHEYEASIENEAKQGLKRIGS